MTTSREQQPPPVRHPAAGAGQPSPASLCRRRERMLLRRPDLGSGSSRAALTRPRRQVPRGLCLSFFRENRSMPRHGLLVPEQARRRPSSPAPPVPPPQRRSSSSHGPSWPDPAAALLCFFSSRGARPQPLPRSPGPAAR
ncbi:hypothetical protein ACQJBY_028454 [Aegilops geniculata]